MADEPITRTPMTLPGAQYVIEVPDTQVEERLAAGWRRVRTSRRADTATDPASTK